MAKTKKEAKPVAPKVEIAKAVAAEIKKIAAKQRDG
jgi:hypothetical protein